MGWKANTLSYPHTCWSSLEDEVENAKKGRHFYCIHKLWDWNIKQVKMNPDIEIKRGKCNSRIFLPSLYPSLS
jgi:hypothetical protein